jgi:predicted secreted protein
MSIYDIGFIPEVQHHRDAYVSVEVSTKDQVPLNPKPLRMTIKVNPVIHYQSSHRGRQYKLFRARPQVW